MSELNETATRKAPEAELAESVAECVRLTKQTVSDIRAIRRAHASRYWNATDEDGDCSRCGIAWTDEEKSGDCKHECPPGFWN